MKHFIKSLALLLCLAVGFVSCNEMEEADATNVTYPAAASLKSWTSQHTTSGLEYTVDLAVNLAGDTVMNVCIVDTEKNHFYMTSQSCSYDMQTGMAEAEFATSPFGFAARVYLALRRDLVNTSVQFFLVSGQNKMLQDGFVAVPVPSFNLYASAWQSTVDKTTGEPASLMLFNAEPFDGQDVRVDFSIGADLYAGTYTWDKNTGKGVVVCKGQVDPSTGQLGSCALSGKELPLSVNAANLLVMTVNGQDFVYERAK